MLPNPKDKDHSSKHNSACNTGRSTSVCRRSDLLPPRTTRVAVERSRRSPKYLKNILNEDFLRLPPESAVNPGGSVFLAQIFLGK